MPCRDPGYDPWDRTEEVQKINKLTRLLCSTLSHTHSSEIKKLPKEVQDWWKAHQEADRQRQIREQEERMRKIKKKEALKKLSAEERKLLGL